MSGGIITGPEDTRRNARRSGRAFTLIELLVVLAIMGILAAVALPKLPGIGKSNAIITATRQLLDDVAQARAYAIGNRANVYIVFVPPQITEWMTAPTFFSPAYTTVERAGFSNLVTEQYVAYALFADRTVGDQPGQKYPRFLTPWKTLPDGAYISTNKFHYNATPLQYINGVMPFATNSFPFPLASSRLVSMPYIAFDYQGRLVSQHDETLSLARGSIFYPRGDNGVVASPYTADPQENPPLNSVTASNHVRVDWLTGRGAVEKVDLR